MADTLYRVTWVAPEGAHVAYTADERKARELVATVSVPGYAVEMDRGRVTWGEEEAPTPVAAPLPSPPEPAAAPVPRRPLWRRLFTRWEAP